MSGPASEGVADPLGGLSFASDNQAGVHPAVMDALAEANHGHAASYGDDEWTARFEAEIRRHFGEGAEGYCLFNGTGANIAALASLTRPWEGVICTEIAHLAVDECGGPERLAGVKLLTVPAERGRLGVADVSRWEARRGDTHQIQPRLVSITQASELGTVYSAEQTREIAEAAHELGMYLHVDGARLANAAAALEVGLGELTTELGVDVVSLGGTKNGLMVGDAVVFCRERLGDDFHFVRKQMAQLGSKSRFLAAQFAALLSDDLWLQNAAHANAMARRLAAATEAIDGIDLAHPVESNAVFARLPRVAIERLLAELVGEHPFHIWDEEADQVRWMCAWDTTPEAVDAFAAAVAAAVPG